MVDDVLLVADQVTQLLNGVQALLLARCVLLIVFVIVHFRALLNPLGKVLAALGASLCSGPRHTVLLGLAHGGGLGRGAGRGTAFGRATAFFNVRADTAAHVIWNELKWKFN